jgi:hypothetical protein
LVRKPSSSSVKRRSSSSSSRVTGQARVGVDDLERGLTGEGDELAVAAE